jgi:hypothetical protein
VAADTVGFDLILCDHDRDPCILVGAVGLPDALLDASRRWRFQKRFKRSACPKNR